MKKGWTYKKLGEVATKMYRGSGIKRDQVTKDGVPCVRYGEIYTTYNIAFDSCVSHSKEDFISSPKYFEHGDLLFAITGESVEDIGKTIAYLGHDKCLLGGDIVCMKHEQDPKYLSYALSTPGAIRQKGLGKTKLKVVHTNIPSLSEIQIPIPPLSEQHTIVARLDAAFANIDALKANAEKQLSEARQLFQAELTECMRPKEGWEEKTLGDICSKITDGSHNPPKGVVHSDNMMLSSQNVQNGFLDLSSVRYLSKNDFDKENLRTRASKGDVLLTIVGTIGRTCVLTGDEGNITFQRSVSILKPEDEIDSYFLMYYLMSQNESLNKKAQGAAQKGIYLKQLANCVISYPTLINQQQIVSHLNSMNEKVRELEEIQRKTITECEALKQAMLKEVFE